MRRAALGRVDEVVGVVEACEVDQPFRHAEDLLHARAERRAEAAGVVLCQPCPADLHHREAVEVPGAGRRLLRPVRDERRGQGGQGHALPFDEGEGRLRARVRRDHHGSAGHEGAQHAGAGEGEVEAEGQDRQVHGPCVECADVGAGAGVVGVVVVRARDELGQARGAAGEQQEGEGAGVRVAGAGVEAGRVRAVRPQRVKGDDVLVRARVTDHDDVAQRAARPQLCAYLTHQLTVIEPGVPIGHHTGHGTRQPYQVADLPAPVPGHGVHRHRPEPLQPEPDEHELGAVGELDHHPVAPPDPQSAQSGGDAVGLRVELRVGPAPVAVDHRDALRVCGARLPQTGTEGDALPVSGGPVARRFRLRPGRLSVRHGSPPLICPASGSGAGPRRVSTMCRIEMIIISI